MKELSREEVIIELSKLSFELMIIDEVERFKDNYGELTDKLYKKVVKLKKLMQKRGLSVLVKTKYLKANAEYEFVALANCYNDTEFMQVRKEIIGQRYGYLKGVNLFDFVAVNNMLSLMKNENFSYEKALNIVNKTNAT